MLLLATLLLLSACTQPPAESLQARQFKQMALAVLDGLQDKVTPALARDDRQAVDNVMEDIFVQAAKQGKPLAYGLAVMDAKGVLLAGRYPGYKGGETAGQALGKQKYTAYRQMQKVYEQGRTAACLLHGPGGKLFAVGRPVFSNGKIIGLVCVGYPQEIFNQSGLTQEEFSNLDFQESD